MGQSIFINFDSESLTGSRCRAADDLRSRKFSPMVAGDSLVFDLFLTGVDGLLNIQNYSVVRMGVGNLNARPESGTYSVGAVSLDYNNNAADLETAIETATGNGCVVVQLSPFVFKVTFDAVGAQTIPSIDESDLTPRSTVDRQTLQTGDATTREIWLWRLYANPIAFTDVFVDVAGNGAQGTLALSTAGIYDLLGDNTSVKTFFEIELTDSAGDIVTVMQTEIVLTGEVIGNGFAGYIPSATQIPPAATEFLASFGNLTNTVDPQPEPTISEGLLTLGSATAIPLNYFLRMPQGSVDGYTLRASYGGYATWQPTNISYPYSTSFENGVAIIRDLAATSGATGWSADPLLTSVFIGSNCKEVGDNTFAGSVNLKQVSISYTERTYVTETSNLGANAFNNCTGLEKVELPYGFETIGNSAFENCTSLESFDFPSSVYLIGTSSFRNTGLISVNTKLPDQLYDLGNYAFAYCTALESVSFHTQYFSRIGSGCFRGSTILHTASFSENDQIESFAFEGCISLINLELANDMYFHDTLTLLGESCFRNCTALTTVNIPESPQGGCTFEAACFRDCTNLSNINCFILNAPILTGANHFLNVATTEIHVRVGAQNYGTTWAGLTVVYDLPESA
jgi:hypothetical protein